MWCGGLLLAALAQAQPRLYLKQGHIPELAAAGSAKPLKRKVPSRSHRVLQFEREPDAGQLRSLAGRGIEVVGYLPEHALVVFAPDEARLDDLGLAGTRQFAPEEKLSVAAAPAGVETAHWVVEFHPDTVNGPAREIALESGLRILEHPDLAGHQLTVSGTPGQLVELSEWDEVAYIYPASRDLIEGRPVVACAGAATPFATVGQYVSQVSRGWSSGPGGTVNLFYHFGQMGTSLPVEQAHAEIERAFAEWARHARLSFSPGASATGARTINLLFASGGHGDPYPFDGRGKKLAHTFYPAPPNPEPLAGDVHFDDDEGWRIGADTDLYSVALHEIGHALGLGHGDIPGTVMYPFYRRAENLTREDVEALQALYPARETADPPAEVLRLVISSPPAMFSTTAESIALTGTVVGGLAPVQLVWSSDRGGAGTASASGEWRIAAIPLWPGRNLISVTATDARASSATQQVTVTRKAATVPGPERDTVAPALTVQSPAGNNLLVGAAAITLRGTARDNVGVAGVKWSAAGRSGAAQGTTSWVIADLPLLVGANTIVIQARDAAGNTAWRSISITRH